jgi:hypothetical protein
MSRPSSQYKLPTNSVFDAASLVLVQFTYYSDNTQYYKMTENIKTTPQHQDEEAQNVADRANDTQPDQPRAPHFIVKDPNAIMQSAAAAQAGAHPHAPHFIIKDPNAVMQSAAASHSSGGTGHMPPFITKDPAAVMASAAASSGHPGHNGPVFKAKDPNAVAASAAAARSASDAGDVSKAL